MANCKCGRELITRIEDTEGGITMQYVHPVCYLCRQVSERCRCMPCGVGVPDYRNRTDWKPPFSLNDLNEVRRLALEEGCLRTQNAVIDNLKHYPNGGWREHPGIKAEVDRLVQEAEIRGGSMMVNRIRASLHDYPGGGGDIGVMDAVEMIRGGVVNQCITIAENLAKTYRSATSASAASTVAMAIYSYFQTVPGVRPPE